MARWCRSAQEELIDCLTFTNNHAIINTLAYKVTRKAVQDVMEKADAKGLGEIQQRSDTIPSPEELEQFHNTLDKFLLSLPQETVNDSGGWSTVRYRAEVADGDHEVYVVATLIRHEKSGVVSREFVRIMRGVGDVGSDIGSDFVFTISNDSGGSLTINTETGEVISGVNEVMKFEDNAAIEVRRQQLLDDPAFYGRASAGVVIPNLQVTPSGEIYEDGSLTLDQKRLGALCVKTAVFHASEDDRRVFERQSAASAQAQKDIGTELTTKRMARVTEVLRRIQQQIQ